MPVVDFNSFPTLLDERYQEIEQMLLASEIDMIPDMYTQKDSDRRQERKGSVGEFGAWPEFSGELSYDRIYEQYNVLTTHREYAVGMRITQRMLEDDLSGVWDGDMFEPMARSGLYTRQQHAVRVLQFATSNDQTFYVRSEGVALASNSHLSRTPNVLTTTGFDNLATAALSPTSYRANRIQQRQFRNDRAQIANIISDELWVPIDLEPRAQEILYSDRHPDSAENRINPESTTRMPTQIKVAIHWTDTNDWCLMNSVLRKRNQVWWERIRPQYRTIGDFDTFQVKVGGRGRWGTMVLDWRQMMFASVG